MHKVMLVGLGGFVGSVARYAMTGGFQRWLPWLAFPLGTLAVNVLGCFLIGFVGMWAEARGFFNPSIRALLFIGALGGFTTFSTFAYETLAMSKGGQGLGTGLNVTLHLAGCLLAVWLGHGLGRALWAAA